jgi:hypothetical protein
MATKGAATLIMSATADPDTEYQSYIVDPMPDYPEHAGTIGAQIESGPLTLKFNWGYATPAHIHAAIARLRDALDQLDIDVDAAMERQGEALAPIKRFPDAVCSQGTGRTDCDCCEHEMVLPDGVEFVGTVGQFLDGIGAAPGELMEAFGK